MCEIEPVDSLRDNSPANDMETSIWARVAGDLVDASVDDFVTPAKVDTGNLGYGRWKSNESQLDEIHRVGELIAFACLNLGDEDNERQSLLRSMKTLDPQGTEDIEKYMDRFESRKDKDGLSTGEIVRTYKEIARLLEANDNSVVPAADRLRLARQILRHAAFPHDLNQGHHNTCAPTTLSSRLYTRRPSQAARIIADVAQSKDGSFRTLTGKPVRIEKKSLKPDEEAAKSPTDYEKRTYANQILQLAMVNAYWTGRRTFGVEEVDGPVVYTQEFEVNKHDSGERLTDRSTGKVLDRAPCIDARGMVALYDEISGEKSKPFLVLDETQHNPIDDLEKAGKQDKSKLIFVDSNEKLRSVILKNQTELRNMPLIVAIDPHKEPWSSAGAASSARASGSISPFFGAPIGREDRTYTDDDSSIDDLFGDDGLSKRPSHVVNILRIYRDADSGKWMVQISNSWGKKSDFAVEIEVLYRTLNRK